MGYPLVVYVIHKLSEEFKKNNGKLIDFVLAGLLLRRTSTASSSGPCWTRTASKFPTASTGSDGLPPRISEDIADGIPITSFEECQIHLPERISERKNVRIYAAKKTNRMQDNISITHTHTLLMILD